MHSQGLEHQVQFIDFEYSCISFRGFDWGNHFNEYAGFECEYTRYPDRAQAATFLAAYLAGDDGSIPVRLCLSLFKQFLPFVNTQAMYGCSCSCLGEGWLVLAWLMLVLTYHMQATI